ncbi:hypothetical protein KSD_72790 [Ktedonobacter sp. SOSP1-85]|nr:hypothetical protein KSD_72790 [Ktedonobacter sp. SOSP1-85]
MLRGFQASSLYAAISSKLKDAQSPEGDKVGDATCLTSIRFFEVSLLNMAKPFWPF